MIAMDPFKKFNGDFNGWIFLVLDPENFPIDLVHENKNIYTTRAS